MVMRSAALTSSTDSRSTRSGKIWSATAAPFVKIVRSVVENVATERPLTWRYTAMVTYATRRGGVPCERVECHCDEVVMHLVMLRETGGREREGGREGKERPEGRT